MDVYQRRRLVAGGGLVAFVSVVVIAVGGGGDDEAPVTTVGASGVSGATGVGGPLSKGAFVDRADGICAEANAAAANLSAEGGETDPELEIRLGELDQLEQLSPPQEDQRHLRAFLSAQRDLVDALERRQLANERNDTTALGAVETEIATAESEAKDAAMEYGFEECGSFDAPEDAGDVATDPTEVPAPAPAPAPAPVEPAPTTPAPAPAPAAPAPPADDGSGGVSPESGGVSP